MSKTDTGKQWLGIPVYIVEGEDGSIDIATESKEQPEPMFIVSQRMFDEIERDFEGNKATLLYLKRKVERGEVEPLTAAAEAEDERSKKKDGQ